MCGIICDQKGNGENRKYSIPHVGAWLEKRIIHAVQVLLSLKKTAIAFVLHWNILVHKYLKSRIISEDNWEIFFKTGNEDIITRLKNTNCFIVLTNCKIYCKFLGSIVERIVNLSIF